MHPFLRSLRAIVAGGFAIAAAVFAGLAAATPAVAVVPQPVDASDQGALAFVCFAIMCGLIAASLFYMDRVRRRRSPDGE
jgi:hypothetical protein